MPMQLILTEDIDKLGKAGELITVKPGYGRNYLLPQGKAVLATPRNKAKLEHDQAAIAKRIAKEIASSEALAKRLNGMTLQFERVVGEEDKLFGSVTARDIGEQLKVAGLDIDHRKIQLDEPIKALGKYEVPIKVGGGKKAELKFWVVAQEQ